MLLRVNILPRREAKATGARLAELDAGALVVVSDPDGPYLLSRPGPNGFTYEAVGRGKYLGMWLPRRGGQIVAVGVRSTARGLEAAGAIVLAEEDPGLPSCLVWVGGRPRAVQSGDP